MVMPYPRVRTWIREYVSSSDLLLNSLQLTAIDGLALIGMWPGLSIWLSGDDALNGVGSEILYRYPMVLNGQWELIYQCGAPAMGWNNTLKLADYSTLSLG